MLKLNEGHMNAIHVQMMNQQKYNEGGSIIIIFNLMDNLYKQKHVSHINTFKKDKINDSFKTIYF